MHARFCIAAALLCLQMGLPATAQIALPPGLVLPKPTPNDSLVSPRIDAGGVVTLSLYAPDAKSVLVDGEWLPFLQTQALRRDDRGVWSVTTTVKPGTYRYTFSVDGAIVVDPRNPQVSPTNTSVRSLFHVSGPGSEFEDTRDVPHGAVARVTYRSKALGLTRSVHVYTPPGYERGSARLPVLYLLHGGGDADASWSTVGRAGDILDNLIAAGKARPMIVVMPAGHVPQAPDRPGALPGMGAEADQDPFTHDLLEDIVPLVERTYRVSTRPQDRALAGLSMGGLQTANIALTHSAMFLWVGIFSSGWFPDVREQFARAHGADLDASARQLKLLWVGWGSTDIARDNSKAMLQLFDAHHLRYQSKESDGGHTWENWRHYLAEFAPLLFR